MDRESTKSETNRKPLKLVGRDRTPTDVLDFLGWNFEFVSDFGFRVSDFPQFEGWYVWALGSRAQGEIIDASSY